MAGKVQLIQFEFFAAQAREEEVNVDCEWWLARVLLKWHLRKNWIFNIFIEIEATTFSRWTTTFFPALSPIGFHYKTNSVISCLINNLSTLLFQDFVFLAWPKNFSAVVLFCSVLKM